jgi:hypothetical protein
MLYVLWRAEYKLLQRPAEGMEEAEQDGYSPGPTLSHPGRTDEGTGPLRGVGFGAENGASAWLGMIYSDKNARNGRPKSVVALSGRAARYRRLLEGLPGGLNQAILPRNVSNVHYTTPCSDAPPCGGDPMRFSRPRVKPRLIRIPRGLPQSDFAT